MALSADRNTPAMGDSTIPAEFNIGIKTGVTIYKGALVGVETATGYLVPMTAATGIVAAGRASKQVAMGAGASGSQKMNVEQGIFRWVNKSTDLIANTEIGQICYAYDDQTVGKTSAGGTLSPAGMVLGVDSIGVWVLTYVGMSFGQLADGSVGTAEIADLAVTIGKMAASSKAAVTNGGAGNSGKLLALDANGKAAGRVLETDGAKLDAAVATSNVGVGDAGKLVKLDAQGKVCGHVLENAVSSSRGGAGNAGKLVVLDANGKLDGIIAPASPTAITQTYSTADVTVPADTAHTITDSSGGTPSTTALASQSVTMTGVDGAGSNAASKADVDAVLAVIRNNISTLKAELALAQADALAAKKVINTLVDILQAAGLAA